MYKLLLPFLLVLSAYSLSLDETKHLLNRTSFGYTKNDLERFQNFSRKEAIKYLIQQGKNKSLISPPKDIKNVSTYDGKFKDLSPDERKVLRKARHKKMKEIQLWWYKMILKPQYAFREKMTLFWHNHFVSEYTVVKSPFMMYKQNMMFRDNALRNFDELLHKSSIDMAMLVYLDSNSNKKSHPNENYARELLELFTLGEGNYTEEDIKEAARAFTGLRVNKKKASFKLVKKHHDYGRKTFLGHKGNFFGKDIINIILKQKQTARFITTKLYKEFISKKTNEQEIERLADIFRNSGYDISILMENLLLSEQFWDKKNRSNMIKSPVEFIASLIKSLEIDLKEKHYNYISKTSKNLGQVLFNPPSVKGWNGGRDWIDSTSLINRNEFVKVTIKKTVKKKHIKNLNLKNYKEFANYFYSHTTADNLAFKNNKKTFQALLSKPIYNLK